MALTTYRAAEEIISGDPAERTDGDTTIWQYDEATGLLLRKTYADGTSESYDYDALNRLEYSTNARSITAERTYAPLTGELISIVFDDGATTQTPAVAYAYNHLGMVTSIADGSGLRTFTYNQYNERESETTQGMIGSVLTHALDSLGRNAGYSLSYAGETAQAVTNGYDVKGRMGSVALNGLATPFTYGYNSTHGLLETLSYPNTLTRWYTYEDKRDLVTKVDYLRPGSANYPAKTDYAYDELGRPTEKKDYFNTASPDLTHIYSYNARSELTADAMSRGGTYGYDYDNIGNRKTAQEGTEAPLTTYAANGLNQYTTIAEGTKIPFTPTYDTDGNQTKVKTSTGEWNVTYNGLNQAIRFEHGGKRVECVYDYLNRRVEKAVYEDDTLVSKKHFIYNGFLQIAELDATNVTDTAPARIVKTYLWDPAEPVATRVLVMRNHDDDGSHEDLYYTHDLLKNTTALFGILAGRRALYEYAPYGATIKSEGDMAEGNPFRFSSEYHDDELGLIQYNYRYLNPRDGRWLSRDLLGEEERFNLLKFTKNCPNCYRESEISWDDFENLTEYITRDYLMLKGEENIIISTHTEDFDPNYYCPLEDCISRLTIYVHGYYSAESNLAGLKWDNPRGTELIETSSVQYISNLIASRNIRFCKNATFEIVSCSIGKSLTLKNNLFNALSDNSKNDPVNIVLYPYSTFPNGWINPLGEFIDWLNN